jgi:tetratricopeptide (TPR) repeat protein/predicted Ser/Thr protein kinase
LVWPSEIPRGTTVGRYTILSLVGSGGMGEVYAAFDPELDRKVALKLLRADAAPDPARGHERLLRKAKALARISHRNVVAVHDVGTFGGRVFVAMEFVDGSTLRDWLAERPRPRAEIVAAFLEAARGLMAAHAAGLIHRDFKPSNVMVARDGRVCVADFGLARDQQSDAAAENDGAPPPDTDQFSFCAALYEALYGGPPFGEGGVGSSSAAVVPDRVRRALLRGLSASPAERWPSMQELVDALKPPRARLHRRWGVAAGVALLIVPVAIVFVGRGKQPAPTCKGGPARLADTWSPPLTGGPPDPRRAKLERAFVATGAPGAKDVWTRVETALDRYASSWLAAYQDTCAATHVRREQSAAVLDLRMACLDDRKTGLHALVEVFAATDRETVAKSVDAALALPGLERCRDVKLLRSATEPPRDEATKQAVSDLRVRIARAKALSSTGKHVEAHALEREIVADARRLDYRPALVEALGELAVLYTGPVEGPEVIPLVEEALWTTLASDRADLAAKAAVARSNMAYYFSSTIEEAWYWLTLARTLVERAPGENDRLRSWILHTSASTWVRANDLARARADMEEAIAIKERILPPGHPDIAISHNTMGEILHAMGRHEEALRLNQRTYEAFVSSYGAASAEAAYTLSNRGEYLLDVNRPAEAVSAFQRGLAGWEAHIGANHKNLAFPLTGLGRALVQLGRAQEAIPPLERALRLREPGPADPALLAETRFALAQALWAADAGRPRALSLATAALETYVGVGQKEPAERVRAWLATSRPSPSRPGRAPSR